MASECKPALPPESLTRFEPLWDPGQEGAPYTLDDRLIVPVHLVPDAKPIGPISTSVQIGDVTIPFIFPGEYSYGATTDKVHQASRLAVETLGSVFGIGEGGIAPGIADSRRLMVQLASGFYGITAEGMQHALILTLKMAQSAKIGQGGEVLGEDVSPGRTKLTPAMADTRRMPYGISYFSDANLVFSIEEVRHRVQSAKKASKGRPVLVKVAASHDIATIVAGVIRAGADGIIIDARGGTGAAPVILRDRVGTQIEVAIATARRVVCELGVQDRFIVVAAGRIDLNRKATKLMLLGANAVMVATAALISMGCKVVHRCHIPNGCPAVTASDKRGSAPYAEAIQDTMLARTLNVEWAAGQLTNYLRAFIAGVEADARFLGFSDVQKMVGHSELLRGIALDPILYAALGIERAEGFGDVEAEMEALWRPKTSAASIFYTWHLDHNQKLAQTGSVITGSMGRTNDCDPPRTYLDGLIWLGSHVVRPSNDRKRDPTETTTLLKGGTKLDIPLLLGAWGAEEVNEALLAAVASRRSALLVDDRVFQTTDSLAVPYLRHSLLQLSPDQLRDWFDAQAFPDLETQYRLRTAAALVLPRDLATSQMIRWLYGHTDRPVYTTLAATGQSGNQAIDLVRNGVQGILLEGLLGISNLGDGAAGHDPVPLELALPEVHDALRSVTRRGERLRSKVSLLASGTIRAPDDLAFLCALGANAVVTKAPLLQALSLQALPADLPDIQQKNDQQDAIEKWLRGYLAEFTTLLSAAGARRMDSVTGNRGLLRVDEMPESVGRRMGVGFMVD